MTTYSFNNTFILLHIILEVLDYNYNRFLFLNIIYLLKVSHGSGAVEKDLRARSLCGGSACSPLGIMNLDVAYILIPQPWQAIRSSLMDRVGR